MTNSKTTTHFGRVKICALISAVLWSVLLHTQARGETLEYESFISSQFSASSKIEIVKSAIRLQDYDTYAYFLAMKETGSSGTFYIRKDLLYIEDMNKSGTEKIVKLPGGFNGLDAMTVMPNLSEDVWEYERDLVIYVKSDDCIEYSCGVEFGFINLADGKFKKFVIP